jgi:nitrogen fixation protein FixH
MLGPSNYVAFFTVVGFFVGTSFGILKADDAAMLLFWPLAITVTFYILAVAVASHFIGTTEVKKNVYLNSEFFETKYDNLAYAISSKEKELMDSIDFRIEVEREEHEEALERLNKAKSKKKKQKE